jgi:hypothetical protein
LGLEVTVASGWNDTKADKLLTREYRKGFEIPKLT